MLWHMVEHILELDLAQFTLMKLAVLETRTFSLTVPGALLSTVGMPTQRMLECDVKVRRNGPMISLFNLYSIAFFSTEVWESVGILFQYSDF